MQRGGPLDGVYSGNADAPARLLQAPRKYIRFSWDDAYQCYFVTFGGIENNASGSSEVTLKLDSPTIKGAACTPLKNIYIKHEAQNMALYRNNTTGLGQNEKDGGTDWKTKIPTDTQIFDEVKIASKDLGHFCTPAGDWISDGAAHYKLCSDSSCGKHVLEAACTQAAAYTTENGSHHKKCTVCGNKVTATEGPCSGDTWVNTDAQEHWKLCDTCNVELPDSRAEHDYAENTATDTCGNLCRCGKDDGVKRYTGYLPEILGTKILVGTKSSDPQKLRVDIDFSNLPLIKNLDNGTITVAEYGAIVAPLTNDLLAGDKTNPDLIDVEALKGKGRVVKGELADIQEGQKNILEVVVNIPAADYGKRIALIAYVKDSQGVMHYSLNTNENIAGLKDGVISTGVMRVIKNILKDQNVQTGFYQYISPAVDAFIENDTMEMLNVKDRTAAVMKDLIRNYAAGDVLVNNSDNDYKDAKTASTYVYYYCGLMYGDSYKDFEDGDFDGTTDWD